MEALQEIHEQREVDPLTLEPTQPAEVESSELAVALRSFAELRAA